MESQERSPKSIFYKFIFVIITIFPFGLSKLSPGTIGSIAALLIWTLVGSFFEFSLTYKIIIFVLTTIISFISIQYYYKLNKSASKDPGFIVIDEAAGLFLTLIAYPFDTISYLELFICFLLFRFFDISKILFIKKIDNLKNIHSITFDDLLAGLYALICFVIYLQF